MKSNDTDTAPPLGQADEKFLPKVDERLVIAVEKVREKRKKAKLAADEAALKFRMIGTGKVAAIRSQCSGMQIHAFGGFRASYTFNAPEAGECNLTIRVATVQDGQVFITSFNGQKSPAETPVPYSTGLWQKTQPIRVDLERGKNTLHFELKEGSRGVTIKDFILTPVG